MRKSSPPVRWQWRGSKCGVPTGTRRGGATCENVRALSRCVLARGRLNFAKLVLPADRFFFEGVFGGALLVSRPICRRRRIFFPFAHFRFFTVSPNCSHLPPDSPSFSDGANFIFPQANPFVATGGAAGALLRGGIWELRFQFGSCGKIHVSYVGGALYLGASSQKIGNNTNVIIYYLI